MEEDIRKEAEKFLNKLKTESNKPKNIYDFNTVVPNYILLPLKNLTEELIEKNKEQEKVIELMADFIDLYYDGCVDSSKSECTEKHCQKCIIDYFRKKAKGE